MLTPMHNCIVCVIWCSDKQLTILHVFTLRWTFSVIYATLIKIGSCKMQHRWKLPDLWAIFAFWYWQLYPFGSVLSTQFTTIWNVNNSFYTISLSIYSDGVYVNLYDKINVNDWRLNAKDIWEREKKIVFLITISFYSIVLHFSVQLMKNFKLDKSTP